MKKKAIFKLLLLISVLATSFYLFSDKSGDNLPPSLQKSSNKMFQGEYDSAIYYGKAHINITEHHDQNLHAYSIIAYSFYAKNELDSSLHYYQKALSIKKATNISLQAGALNTMGVIYETKHIHDRAIKHFKKSIDLYEKIDSDQLPSVYYNLAYNQSQTDNIACLQSYYTALEYASEFNDKTSEAYCLSDLGNLMLETNNYESAIEFFQASLENDYAKNNPRRKAIALQGLGEAEYQNNNFGAAKTHALEALKIKTENNFEDFLFTSYRLLGRIYRDTDDLEESENNFKRAIIYFPHNNRNKKFIDVFRELSDVQLQLGKNKQSEYHNQLHYEESKKFHDEKEKVEEMVKIAI